MSTAFNKARLVAKGYAQICFHMSKSDNSLYIRSESNNPIVRSSFMWMIWSSKERV